MVVTGTGVVSPIGVGRQAFWDALMQQRSGISVREPFTELDSPLRLAGAIRQFDPRQHIKNRKALKVMCREIQTGCAAANLAVAESQLDLTQVDPNRLGVISGAETYFCNPADLTDVYKRYLGQGEIDLGMWIEAAVRDVEPLWMLKYLPNMVSCQIGIALDARGPNNTIVQGDASGLLAIMEAAELIRRGLADIMITGSSGAKMNLVSMLYHGLAEMCRSVEDPAEASKPFDLHRRGLIAGEGAGMIVLESLTHARRRGANILAKIASVASTCCTAVSDMQSAIQRSITTAMQKSGFSHVDHAMAHAQGVPEDRVEAQAIHEALDSTPVTALKSYYGNLGVGSGSLDLIASVLSLQEGLVPVTLNYQHADPACPVNVVHTEARQQQQHHSIILSQSTTGQATAILLSKDV